MKRLLTAIQRLLKLEIDSCTRMLDGVPTHISSPWQWGPLDHAEPTSYSLDQVLIAPLCLSVSHRRLRFHQVSLGRLIVERRRARHNPCSL